MRTGLARAQARFATRRTFLLDRKRAKQWSDHVRSPSATPAGGPVRWRGLVLLWAVMLIGATTGAAILQVLGPPPTGSERPIVPRGPIADVVVPGAPANPVRARQPARPASAQEKPPNDEIASLLNTAKAQITDGRIQIPPGDNAAETLERVSATFSKASPIDQGLIIDVKVRLYERAQAAAGTGNFDEAERVLALAAKLPTNLPSNAPSMPDPMVRDRGATAANGPPPTARPTASPDTAADGPGSGPSRPSATATRAPAPFWQRTIKR